MAERYQSGLQRIFYRTKGRNIPDGVQVRLWDHKVEDHVILDLQKVNDFGWIWYFDFIFEEGIYLAIYYENGVVTEEQVYNIIPPPSGGVIFKFKSGNLL